MSEQYLEVLKPDCVYFSSATQDGCIMWYRHDFLNNTTADHAESPAYRSAISLVLRARLARNGALLTDLTLEKHPDLDI